MTAIANIRETSANANAIPAATWFLFEIMSDPQLQSRLREELQPALLSPVAPAKVPTYNVEKLCSGPLLQSIYAETLRLRVSVVVGRMAQHDLKFRGWDIRKGETVSVSNLTEAMDDTIWNTGSESDPHPLDTFWADRFLIYPNDPASGPLKHPRISKPGQSDQKMDEGPHLGNRGVPRFSLEGLTNSWIPYSGGPRLCPGRHFAKQEMISAAAIMMAAFDIELLENRQRPTVDDKYFGFGTMPPNNKIPCRMKRRVVTA